MSSPRPTRSLARIAPPIANMNNNTATFPPVQDLPTKSQGIDTRYTLANDEPRVSWCLLIEVATTHPKWTGDLICVDRDSQSVVIRFRGEMQRYMRSLHKPPLGRTMVILCPLKDIDGNITVTRQGQIRMFHFKLETLMGVSESLHRFSVPNGEPRRCYGCGAEESNMMLCTGCGLCWFCNNECKSNTWSQGTHAEDCRLLRNENLKRLFLLDWEQPGHVLSFPF